MHAGLLVKDRPGNERSDDGRRAGDHLAEAVLRRAGAEHVAHEEDLHDVHRFHCDDEGQEGQDQDPEHARGSECGHPVGGQQ